MRTAFISQTSSGNSGNQYRPRSVGPSACAAKTESPAAGQEFTNIELSSSSSKEGMMDNFFRPGDTCQSSGVYEVIDDGHASRHRELTVVRGEPFPPCRQCLSVQYRLGRAAPHPGPRGPIAQARSPPLFG